MAAMAEVVEVTLAGMGFELVDARASGGGGICPSSSTGRVALPWIIVRTSAGTWPGCSRSRASTTTGSNKAADFARFAGSNVDVRMRTPDASGRKRFTGLLRGAQGAVATVQVEGRDVALNVDDIDRAWLVPVLLPIDLAPGQWLELKGELLRSLG